MQIYLGTFAIAAATLALEVIVTRLLSVVTWYHLSFFAVATALLGMTAGATAVYLRPKRFRGEALPRSLARACIGFALATPATVAGVSLLSVTFETTTMGMLALFALTGLTALPFYYSGVAVAAILTRVDRPVGKLYAADLLGAAAGSLFVLGGLEVLDAPSLTLVCAALGALAAAVLGRAATSGGADGDDGDDDAGGVPRRPRGGATWPRIATAVVLLALAVLNASAPGRLKLQPLFVKGGRQDVRNALVDRWNSYSRVVVHGRYRAGPHFWSRSPNAPAFPPRDQYPMDIDGLAGTTISPFEKPEDIAHYRWDLTNIGYHLRPNGGALIIGVGGGRDVQSALHFGHERVVAVELNRTFVSLLRGRFREFAGLADHPAVTLVNDEGRSYAAHSDEQFAFIQMSLIDTWAATGAGAFSLSENALYTVEAWRIFLARLAPGGIFSVSRWHSHQDLGETGRLVSLAVASLLNAGVEDPSQHLAMVTSRNPGMSTLLVGQAPLTQRDVSLLSKTATDQGFEVTLLPHTTPAHPFLAELMTARSLADVQRLAEAQPLNMAPPTDEQPYFFNMIRLSKLGVTFSRPRSHGGVVSGNLLATMTLVWLIVALAFFSLVTVVVPLLFRSRLRAQRRPDGVRLPVWGLYFSLIGAGFMFVEIGMLQRLSVFLSHPAHALGILLFTLIASTGVGAWLSERLPLTRRPWLVVFPLVTVGAILVERFLISGVTAWFVTSPTLVKALLAIAVLSPMGLLLGFFFPTGMRLANAARVSDTPWFWALNGVFGVLVSAVAVMVSIYASISTNFYVAALCYFATLVSLPLMAHRAAATPA